MAVTLRTLDKRLVRAARKVRVLSSLSWPVQLEREFISKLKTVGPTIPSPPPVVVDYSQSAQVLTSVCKGAGESVIGQFLTRTAEAYLTAIKMLQNTGTKEFTECSLQLYPAPSHRLHEGAPSWVEQAQHLVDASVDLPYPAPNLEHDDLSAQRYFVGEIKPYFDPPLKVELDPTMGAFAAAGSKRVRLRAGVRYSTVQLRQLVQHEALVHSLTARNGRQQPNLTSLGLSSPRTTATQEGLATLAELITDSMSLLRLRRLALRVLGVNAALKGADFVEVYRLFHDHGQPPEVAFRSTQRLFRGGDPKGTGSVFVKDAAYLPGLFRVHHFLLKALSSRRPELVPMLFAGRMTEGDAVALSSVEGLVTAPSKVPPWAADDGRLAAYLVWAGLSNRIHLSKTSLESFK